MYHKQFISFIIHGDFEYVCEKAPILYLQYAEMEECYQKCHNQG